MTDYVEIASIPILVTIIYWIIYLLKATEIIKQAKYKIIPLLAVGIGIVVSVLAYFFAPNLIIAENIFMAVLIGGSSGLAATGTNQIFKQMTKDSCNAILGTEVKKKVDVDTTQDGTKDDEEEK